jgi:hypothetical protein
LQSKLCNYNKSPLNSPFVKGGDKKGDFKSKDKTLPYEKRIVGQPFKVAHEFAGLKSCHTKNIGRTIL